MASLVAVLLAGVAVALSANRFASRRFDASALLRCLGLSRRETMVLFSLQLTVLEKLGRGGFEPVLQNPVGVATLPAGPVHLVENRSRSHQTPAASERASCAGRPGAGMLSIAACGTTRPGSSRERMRTGQGLVRKWLAAQKIGRVKSMIVTRSGRIPAGASSAKG